MWHEHFYYEVVSCPKYVRHVCRTRGVMCIFKYLPRVHVSCPFQCCRVRAT